MARTTGLDPELGMTLLGRDPPTPPVGARLWGPLMLYQDTRTRNVVIRNKPRVGEWVLVCASIAYTLWMLPGQISEAVRVIMSAPIFGG